MTRALLKPDGLQGRAVAVAGGAVTAARAALDGTWSTVHEVATVRWLVQDAPGAELVLLAPRPDAREHARALAATLENLARSLAVEWARFGVRARAVLPGAGTTDAEIGALVALPASAGGDCFSGLAQYGVNLPFMRRMADRPLCPG